MLGGICFVGATILLTVYGQLVLKWRLDQLGASPDELLAKVIYFIKLMITDPFVFSSFASAFVAGIAWMAALTRFSLSSVYPFMSLSFPLVVVLSGPLLGEAVNPAKFLGVIVICVGLVLVSR